MSLMWRLQVSQLKNYSRSLSTTFFEGFQPYSSWQIVFFRLLILKIIKTSKCFFVNAEIVYLGHAFNGKGIKSSYSKVEHKYLWPTQAWDLKNLLGMINFYSSVNPSAVDNQLILQNITHVNARNDTRVIRWNKK